MKSAVEAGNQASRAFLTDPAQLAHHAGKRGFDWLLDVAKDPNSHAARNNGRVQATSGAVASGVGQSRRIVNGRS
jgi:hypothetical protein